MRQAPRRQLKIDELHANHFKVSVHKYGFFLCRKGAGKILLGTSTYLISRNHLCLYPPNTFFQILEKSDDLEGILLEDEVDTYYPVISKIDIRKRLQMRALPCVKVSEQQAIGMVRIHNLIAEQNCDSPENSFLEEIQSESLRYLRYALCLKVVEAYFGNSPVEAMPQTADNLILNRFLVSVYENCQKHRSVKFYADQQHLSPYYFSSIIQRASGQSAMQWIGKVAMIFSRQYLECQDMSVKEVAELMNFPDQSSFGRYFKHHEGCSPTNFREKYFKRD